MQLVSRAGDVLSGNIGPIELSAALARLSELAVPAEVDEHPLQPAVIPRRDLLGADDVVAELPGSASIQTEAVVLIGRACRQVRELVQPLHQRIDAALTIERWTMPVPFEIAPLNQLPAGVLQPLDRAVFVVADTEPGEARAAKRPLHSLGGIRQLFLKPGMKRRVVQPAGLRLGEDGEQRIDARLHGTFAQQVGAETMDGADLRFFQPAKRIVQPLAFCRAGGRLGARSFELLAQPELQLARGLLGERDGNDFVNLCAAGFDHPDDAVDELGGFACASGGFDDQCVVQIVLDDIAIGIVGKRVRFSLFRFVGFSFLSHGRSLSSTRSAISFFDLRFARRS